MQSGRLSLANVQSVLYLTFRIHSLLVLDGRDINGAEVSEDEDEENVIFGKKKEEGKDENE